MDPMLPEPVSPFEVIPGPLPDLYRVLPLKPPDPPPHDAGWSAVLMALGGAIFPVAIMGAMVGAHAATYSDKQRDWARTGALIGTGTAAALLLVAYVRQS